MREAACLWVCVGFISVAVIKQGGKGLFCFTVRGTWSAMGGRMCRQEHRQAHHVVSQRQRENRRYSEAIKPQARSVPSDMLPLSRLWLLKLPQASQSAPLPGTTRTVKNISHPSHSAIFSLNPEQELAEAGAPVVQPLHPAMVTEGFSSALTMVTNSPTFLSVTQN